MSRFELAQLNVARARAALDDPLMADFVANLDRINGLGEASPGFVWRLRDETGNATAIRAFDDPRMIVNLTIWSSVDALVAFAHRSGHVEVLRRRREWFVPLAGPSVVLWWVPAGHRPSLEEARTRLEPLAANGPASDAFNFGRRFPAPGTERSSEWSGEPERSGTPAEAPRPRA